MTRSVMIVLLLAATLGAAGGFTALVTVAGRDKEIESLSTTLAELQKDLRTAHATVQKLSRQKVELTKSLEDVNEEIRWLKKDFDKTSVQIQTNGKTAVNGSMHFASLCASAPTAGNWQLATGDIG